MRLDFTKVSIIKGIGDAKAKGLLRLGVSTVWDLLTYFPARFEDRSVVKKIFDLENGETACVNATVIAPPQEHFVRKGMTYYKMNVRDDSGIMSVTFFNNKYVKSAFRTGYEYTFYGKVSIMGSKKDMTSPEFEPAGKSDSSKSIIPIYSLTSGISQKFLRTVIRTAYNSCHAYIVDPIPSEILREYSLCPLDFAIKNIHFPSDEKSLEIAKKRLIFEEFFILQTALRKTKLEAVKESGISFKNTDASEFVASLPFSLTNAQRHVISEISSDMSSGRVMNRLVQGDVGSGKTIVAAYAVYLCRLNGFQSAMMAPTEVLARQHFVDLSPLLQKFGITCALLTGSTSTAEKKRIYEALENGSIDVVFGTHALITDKVNFKNLALAITDEQHRFGVRQRLRLSQKGEHTHTLVMTATPIPRTLALIVYGDMDISVIDEMPPGRQKVDTFCVGENMRARVYNFIRKEIAANHRVYVVCPAVEENEELPVKAAAEVYTELSEKVFPDIKCGLIHGKMKNADKESVMDSFINGDTKLLVSTTVIEVGVNVPSATVMVIENAERFGLSQLHQLRGRVGRGKAKSYCILFCLSDSEEIRSRMEIMVKSNNGFEISEKDLTLRGPGEFFGTRQHGMIRLKIADLSRDISVLKESGIAAQKLLSKDPALENDENFYIKRRCENMLEIYKSV